MLVVGSKARSRVEWRPKEATADANAHSAVAGLAIVDSGVCVQRYLDSDGSFIHHTRGSQVNGDIGRGGVTCPVLGSVTNGTGDDACHVLKEAIL
ncbi:hypothetical protein JX266_013534 [Neoarthrinium moseri]|nr:hypothetical protein JX266_013534 [Neoarthrinium moseri]